MASKKRLNIGIDANCLIFSQSGFGRYGYNLVKNLLKVDRVNHYFLYASFLRKKNQRKKILDNLILETNAKNVTVRILPLPAAWKEKLTLLPFSTKNLFKDELDLYYSPDFTGIPKKGFTKTVVTLHDLVFMLYPEHRGQRISRYYLKRTKIAISQSEKIIVPSEATKHDLMNYLHVERRKIVVIPEGVESRFRKIANHKLIFKKTKKYLPKGSDYILSVGTLEPRKNLPLLVKAYSVLPNELKKKFKLVFVGGKGWNNQALNRIINNYNLAGKIIFTGFVPDDDLPYIYNRAKIFVYPSLYEGFGLPVLEALACGTPVICSGKSSLPEVARGAALFVSPFDEEELAEAIKKVALSKKLADNLSTKGQERSKKFHWQETAIKTLKVFEDVAK